MSDVPDKWRGPHPDRPDEDWAVRFEPKARVWEIRRWDRRHVAAAIAASRLLGQFVEWRTEDGFLRFPRALVKAEAGHLNRADAATANVSLARIESPYHDREHPEFIPDSLRLDLSTGTGIATVGLEKPTEWRLWRDELTGRYCAVRIRERISSGVVRAQRVSGNNSVFESQGSFLIFESCEAKNGHEVFTAMQDQAIDWLRIMPPTQRVPLPVIEMKAGNTSIGG